MEGRPSLSPSWETAPMEGWGVKNHGPLGLFLMLVLFSFLRPSSLQWGLHGA